MGPDCGLFFDITARPGPPRPPAQTFPKIVPDAVIRSRSLPAQAEISGTKAAAADGTNCTVFLDAVQ